MDDDTGTTPPAAARTPATPQPGEHFRGGHDDGRRFTYDPACAAGRPVPGCPPWRVDRRGRMRGQPWWASRGMLPAVLTSVSHAEWLVWQAGS